MMKQINISRLLRHFGRQPIGGRSLNLLETNFLKLGSAGFMMPAPMAGMQRVFTGVAIGKAGLWPSLRQRQTSSLVASPQPNGNPQASVSLSHLTGHPRSLGQISPTPAPSFSVWMKAPNTLTRGETAMPLNVTATTVRCLGPGVGTCGSKAIPTRTLKAGVVLANQASCCPPLWGRAVRVTLPRLMVGNTDFNQKNLKSSEYL